MFSVVVRRASAPAAALVAGARVRLGVAAAVALVALGGSTAARASTTVIGDSALASTPGFAVVGAGQNNPVFQGDSSGGYVLSAPVGGTIVSWSFLSAGIANGKSFVLRVLHPNDATGMSWTAVATSPAVLVSGGGPGIDAVQGPFTAGVALPISAGDRIALQPTDDSNTPTEQGAIGQDGIRYFGGQFADGTSASIAPASTTDAGQVVPIQATVDTTARSLTVSLGGSGSGSVHGDQSPAISCPGACAQTYSNGTAVTLTELPAAGSTFAGWGGACSGTSATCRVSLVTDAAVSASFTHGPVPPAPKNTRPPHVEGTPSAGHKLSCTGDTWVGQSLIFSVAWFETTVGHVSGGKIVHTTTQVGTTRTHVLGDDTPGATTYCAVTATNGGGSPTALSPSVAIQATIPALAADFPAAHIFSEPQITPGLAVGQTNTCTPGRWLHHPLSYGFAWYALPFQHATPAQGTLVHTGPKLTIDSAAETEWLVCQVTARNAAGARAALSNRYLVLEPDLGVHVNAIEITQGVQTPELPTRSAHDVNDNRLVYHGVNLPWQSPGDPPVRVELAEHHRTVIRVYVNTQQESFLHRTPTILLRAQRGGRVLAPGLIAPDFSPADVPQGGLGQAPTDSDRLSPYTAYTFTVPWEWTTGDVGFEADYIPPPGSPPAGPAGKLGLGPEHFNRVTAAFLDPIAFRVNTGSGSCPGSGCVLPDGWPNADPAWAQTQAVTPFPIYVPPYKATFDATTTITGGGTASSQRKALIKLVNDWANSNDTVSSRYPFGVAPGGLGFATGTTQGSDGSTPRVLYGDAQPRSVASDDIPLVGLGHELNHGFGRAHAGQSCGSNSNGQVGELWLPNPPNDGALDGYGLDTSAAPPYSIVSPDGTWDLMSYCPGPESPDAAEADHWISVRNWNRDVEFRAPAPVHPARDAAVYRLDPPAAAGAARSLAVSGVLDGGSGTALVTVAPDAGDPTPASAGGTYTLVGRDASGRAIATADAHASLDHVDRSTPLISISGKLAAAGVREVDVLQNGIAVATVKASAHAPTATIPGGMAGAHVGGVHGAVLRWRSGDADGGALEATVRYSANGGRSWSTIYGGPDRGGITLPSGLLSASRDARVRVYISDGFNEAIVTSSRFTALGAPPAVSILSPARAVRIAAGSALDLEGVAYADTGAQLSGRALVWRAGRQLLGHGAMIVTTTLPAGRHRVTLTGRDRLGRAATKVLDVTVTPAPPVLTRLTIPRRVSRRARSVTIRLAVLAPVSVRIGHRVAVVGRRLTSLRLPVPPGRRPIRLVLVLRSGRFTLPVPVVVAR